MRRDPEHKERDGGEQQGRQQHQAQLEADLALQCQVKRQVSVRVRTTLVQNYVALGLVLHDLPFRVGHVASRFHSLEERGYSIAGEVVVLFTLGYKSAKAFRPGSQPVSSLHPSRTLMRSWGGSSQRVNIFLTVQERNGIPPQRFSYVTQSW